MRNARLRIVLFIALALGGGIFGFRALTSASRSDVPVTVRVISCQQDRVDIEANNPTDHRITVMAWVVAIGKSGNKVESTAEADAAPHSKGRGVGRFSLPIKGACIPYFTQAYALATDGQTTPIHSIEVQ